MFDTFDDVSRLQLKMIGLLAAVRFDADHSHSGKHQRMLGGRGIVASAAAAVGRPDARAVADHVALVDADFICNRNFIILYSNFRLKKKNACCGRNAEAIPQPKNCLEKFQEI